MKKTNRANLENRRGMFFQIGLVLTLSLSLLAFEWSAQDASLNSFGNGPGVNDEVTGLIPITRREIVKPPPPKPVVKIKVVDDNEKVDDKDIVPDIEINANDSIEFISFIEEEEIVEPVPFYLVEIVPKFMDGSDGVLTKWIAENSIYPQICISNHIKGTVWVGFTISSSGKLVDIHLLREVDPFLDAEALRVVKSMPDWTPGIQSGKKVPVPYQLPVKFILY